MSNALVLKYVDQFRQAVAAGGYDYTEAAVRGFFDGGWDNAFEKDCRDSGIEPEALVNAVVAKIVG